MEIHPQILNDSEFIVDLELSQVRLIRDGDLDWFLLIPRKDGMKDWSDLELPDQTILCSEISKLSALLTENANPDKINVASLGNMVPQLHIHVIARYKNDRSWPAPIWGSEANKSFDSQRTSFWISKLT